MKYEDIKLSKQADKFIRNLNKKDAKQVYEAIKDITPDRKIKLVGYDLYKKRSGNIRILYTENGIILNIEIIDYRKSVYDNTRRLKAWK